MYMHGMRARSFAIVVAIPIAIAGGGAALLSCSSSSSSDATTGGGRGDVVCVYSTAKCLANLCSGCTAGGYHACPPADSEYGEVCSEEAEASCRANYAGPPVRVSQSSDLTRYTRDVRILHGIGTCADFRASGEGAATSVDHLCTGVCE
jgi:hypothetical protein